MTRLTMGTSKTTMFGLQSVTALLMLLLLLHTTPSARAYVENAQWLCTSSDTCIIDEAPGTGDAQRFETQNDCRLSCGRYGAIWPQPTGDCSLSHQRVHFDPWRVRFNTVAPDGAPLQYLRELNRIFLGNILKECISNCTLEDGKQVLVKATVNASDLTLNWMTDESYEISVATTDMATFVDIKATTVYGCRHGYETLSNLISGSKNKGLLLVAAARVHDRPAYAHRGVLLDTSRNYMPLRVIRNTLDAMAASKLNVFHWHVVDTHSFPLEITRVPELQRFGAYSAEMVYSHKDLQNMIKYARMRGIRVLLEIDGPSHAGNGWQYGESAGLGNMAVCLNSRPWRNFCVQPPCGQLNPLNENMYAVMRDIYADIAEVSAPEETIHFGGDEVYIPCWNNTEEITRKMIDIGYDLSMRSFYKLWSTFHQRNLDAWDEVTRLVHPRIDEPKQVIVWSSHLTDPLIIEEYLPKARFVIQTWVDAEDTLNRELLQKGYRLIVSTKNAWYLDHGFWGRTPYYNWQTVYNNRMPYDPKVLGGEVCMWSEYVDDMGVEARIWPRAGAAAERLWSNPKGSALLSHARFFRYRERLIARGIRPDAVTPRWCVLNEGQCF